MKWRDTNSQAEPHLSNLRPVLGTVRVLKWKNKNTSRCLRVVIQASLPAHLLQDEGNCGVDVCRREDRVLVLLSGSLPVYYSVLSLPLPSTVLLCLLGKCKRNLSPTILHHNITKVHDAVNTSRLWKTAPTGRKVVVDSWEDENNIQFTLSQSYQRLS